MLNNGWVWWFSGVHDYREDDFMVIYSAVIQDISQTRYGEMGIFSYMNIFVTPGVIRLSHTVEGFMGQRTIPTYQIEMPLLWDPVQILFWYFQLDDNDGSIAYVINSAWGLPYFVTDNRCILAVILPISTVAKTFDCATSKLRSLKWYQKLLYCSCGYYKINYSHAVVHPLHPIRRRLRNKRRTRGLGDVFLHGDLGSGRILHLLYTYHIL